ncbi:hypothetical protein CSUB01_08159 [Colletotrichum sublineola]|uniref:PNPLA domain-containing protein n=1 Tax=Colletotrichum sublineola TaxID=1173701 RepID=A0A066XPX3_COLSU|nr:hypothetical protein CSUB01_08159 [Colletotrichum sublineola]
MLGRMGMTTTEAIDCYEKFSRKIFRTKNRRLNRTFKEETLEKTIRDIVAQRKLDKTVMLDTGREKGLTFVCAATYNDYTPYLFRTYRGNSSLPVTVADAPGSKIPTHNHAHNVEIWEAARATTAAPTFFHPITIKVEAEKDEYVDGAVRLNNPARLVLNEAESQFGSGRKLGFLLSLGTGLKTTDNGVNFVPNVKGTEPTRKNSGALLSRGTFKALKHAKQSMTDPEPTHHALEERFRGTPYAYFRLNLDRGAANIRLHEYKKMKVLRAATEEYLRSVQVSADIDKLVSMLHKNEGVNMPLDAACRAVSDEASKLAIAQEIQVKSITSPQFTGRTDILEKMDRHFCQRTQPSPRRHLRIWGMGGVGKTQIALRFRDLCESRFSSVFWINAATENSIYESFRVVTAEVFGGEHNRPNIEGVCRWLAQSKEEWLLIFDNNDKVDVSKYLPAGDNGNILFTSRQSNMSPSLDANQTFAVDVMNEEDALALLQRASKRHNKSFEDEKYGKEIVRELGYLPLAIDQAGSYVDIQECSFGTYLVDFRHRRSEILGDPPLYPGVFEHNPAVYGTFELSYEALERKSKEDSRRGRAALNALRILNIFCFYGNENIPDKIISRAAVYTKLDTEHIKGEDGDLAPLPLLEKTQEGNWDPRNFRDGISTLRSYSLIKKSILHENLHSMHILVHSWVRDRMNEDTLIFQRRAARHILFFTVSRTSRLDEEMFASQVLPHMQACLEHGGLEHLEWMRRTEEEGKYAKTLLHLGMWDKAAHVLEQIVADREKTLGREDWATIVASWDLAKAYRDSSRLQESEKALEEVISLLPSCPDTATVAVKWFDVFIDLAKVYLTQARYEDAKGILHFVAEKHENLGWKSRSFRRAYTTLSTVIRTEGDAETALNVECFILGKCLKDEAIGPGHRMTMSAISNIAALHSDMGMHEKADEMWREVLVIDEELRGRENPITLQSKRNVATGCANLDRLEEAEVILREVLEISERVLWKTHLDTLATMDQLAGVLARRSKKEEAIDLWEECLEGRTCILGDKHPLTEKTQLALNRMRDGYGILVQEDFEVDGFMHSGDSNYVSQAERDRYLY